MKFDYITARNIGYITHTGENSSYPLSAEIETKDYAIESLKRFDTFSYEHELNSNSIEYYYSIDSGVGWNLIEDSNLSSVDTSTNKIRFKAVFYSNQTSTPVLKEMRLGYVISCAEGWTVQYGECSADDVKLKFYTDLNNCGTRANLPEDNGSYAECDYCAPDWTAVQTNCQITNQLIEYYADLNNCYELTGLASDNNPPANNSYECDYCGPTWENVNKSCQINDLFVIGYYYTNNCCEETGLESDCSIPENTAGTCDYCAPDWYCSSYWVCQQNNTKTCADLADRNNCSALTGLESDLDYSGYENYTISCVYDDTPPLLISISLNPAKTAKGGIINITVNITDDKSSISSVVISLKNKENIVKETIILNEENSLFEAQYNTSSLNESVYLVDLTAADDYNNSLEYKNKELFVISPYVKETCSNSYLINENEKTIINSADSKTILELNSFKTVNDTISFIEYSSSPVNAAAERKSAGKYIEIIEQNTSNNLDFAVIKVYYNETEINRLNLDENSLKLYYFNETSLKWQELESFVNTDENYVYVNLTHLSLFGIYGEEIQTLTTSSGVDSGGSGGSSSSSSEGTTGGGIIAAGKTEKIKELTEKRVIPKPRQGPVETGKNETCCYSISFPALDEISFIDKGIYNYSLKNTGDCDIEQISVSLSSNLMEIAYIQGPLIKDLKKGDSAEFAVIKEQTKPLNALIQGFAVRVIEPGVEEYKGEINTIAFKDNVIVVNDSVPVLIKTRSFTQPKEINKEVIGLAALLMLFLFVFGFKLINKKEKKKRLHT